MVIAVDFSGLHVWAQALAVILLLELCVLLVLMAALTFLLAFGARWLQMHVIPLLNASVPRAQQALELTNQGTDRVVRGVAVVHGWRRGLEAGLRVFFQNADEMRSPQVQSQPAAQPAAPSDFTVTHATPPAPAPDHAALEPPDEQPFVVRRDVPPHPRDQRTTTPPAANVG